MKPRCASEHDEQASLVDWAYLAQKTRPDLRMLFAVPNGGLRSKAAAGKLKAEGVKAGVPDLFLLTPRGRFHGLAIEMKSMDGSTSKEQKQWIADLLAQGYQAVVCKGWLRAKTCIENYLDGVEIDQ